MAESYKNRCKKQDKQMQIQFNQEIERQIDGELERQADRQSAG